MANSMCIPDSAQLQMLIAGDLDRKYPINRSAVRERRTGGKGAAEGAGRQADVPAV